MLRNGVLILFLHLMKNSETCTPANEDARIRLKQHLGVEADPKGLDQTAYTNNYINQASDLDCNFEGLCRWKNVPSDNKTDHFDYYYFTKLQNKVWPAVIKPGKNPEVGNHFILSGGKDYKPEDDAVWISSPVQCQKDIGTLTFTYWIYNDGKLQTVLYKAKSDPLQKLLSPTVTPTDCTANVPRGIQCTVTIPPIKEPFQIGIRNYNYKKEGFGAIDDIKYTADICSGAQLRDKLSLNPLETGATGASINDTNQIHCSSWDKTCRWDNDPSNSLLWQQGTGQLDVDSSGGKQNPSSPFAIVKTDATSTASATLVSDPVPCQSGDGTLSLKYWTSGSTEIQVCTMDVKTNLELKPCQTLDKSLSPGPAHVLFKDSIHHPFKISIRAFNFADGGQEAFAVVDEISYESKLCANDEILKSITSSTFGLYEDGLDFATDSHDVDCNFESVCNWYNIKQDDFDWTLTKDKPILVSWQNATGTSSLPTQTYATIPTKTMNRVGLGYLVSKPFHCGKDAGTVTFNFWTSQDSALEMCVLKKGTISPIFCSQTLSGGPGPQTVTVPGPINQPYQLSFKGVTINSNPNFVAVDNIVYRATVCLDTQVASDDEACKSLKCDFTAGQPCNWNINLNMPSNNENFNFFNFSIGAAGNVEVRPTQAGKYFLGVTIKNPEKTTAYIESPEFALKENRKFKISFKRGTFGSIIYVCRNKNESDLNSSNCKKLAGPEITLEDFKGASVGLVDISPDDHKLYIIAKHTDLKFGPAAFGFDDVDLLDSNGKSVCILSQT